MANDLKLDKKLDNNLKPVKIDGESTSIELSKNNVRIKNLLEAAKLIVSELSSGKVETTQISSGDDIELNADGGDVTIKDGSDLHFLFDCNGTRFRIYDDTNTGDHFTIEVDENGASTLTTVDNDGTVGHLTLDSGGNITLDARLGQFLYKHNGTEFSAANSAYAGMILAYTVIGESTTHTTYAMTTSLAVPDSDMNVSFVAPPSGNVEIMVQFHRDSSTSNKFVYVSLSDNATFNAVGNTYTQISGYADETDDYVVNHYWTVTGLTAGNSYQYWFGIRTNGTTTNMKWGGTAANRFCDFIMKATALPATLGGE